MHSSNACALGADLPTEWVSAASRRRLLLAVAVSIALHVAAGLSANGWRREPIEPAPAVRGLIVSLIPAQSSVARGLDTTGALPAPAEREAIAVEPGDARIESAAPVSSAPVAEPPRAIARPAPAARASAPRAGGPSNRLRRPPVREFARHAGALVQQRTQRAKAKRRRSRTAAARPTRRVDEGARSNAVQTARSTAVPASRNSTHGSELGPLRSAYLADIKRRLEARKTYPRRAKRRRQQGTVTMQFAVARNGSLNRARISRSSGHPLLDEAAMSLLRDVAPFPPPPKRLAAAPIELVVPIRYELAR